MRGYIHRLRQKSKEEQSRAAFLIAGVVTAAVVAVWAVSLPARFGTVAVDSEEVGAAKEADQFFAETKSNLQDLVRSAELIKNTGQDVGQQAAVGGSLPETATGTAPEGEVVATGTTATTSTPVERAVPRRVLIATSSAEREAGKPDEIQD